MSGFPRFAVTAALLSACALAACASSGGDDSASSRSASAAQSQPAGQMYTDAQVQSFVAARADIQALPPGTDQARIAQILSSHNLAPDVYNAIGARAQTDQTLANRISAASASSMTFTDAQLQAFATASAEIDPITRTLSTATPEQQQQATLQIRQILARNNLTFEQYNGIAARAQTDDALAARIAAMRSGQTASEPPSVPPTNQ